MISGKNYTNKPNPNVSGETEFSHCNFTQKEPVLSGANYIGVRLFPDDDTPCTFIKCNLVNCEVPPNSLMENCNTTIRRSLVVKEIDEIIIDSHQIPVNVYVDIIYGRQMSSGVYEYHPIPIEILNDTVVE